MSERKAINKWYPPDYDPLKVPKKEKSRNANSNKVRLMLPFSMKCLQCNEYISARRKFNARKETTSEKYMGFKIIKFHFKCPRCNNSIVFRTDPALAGFAPVEGGVRNHESMAKESKIKPMETEDEILARLEREEEESRKYKEQQERRKKNPFWQKQNETNTDVMTNLEEKLAKQQEEQQMHDHLMYLQAKASRLQESGGQERLVKEAQAKLEEEKNLKRESESDELEVKSFTVQSGSMQNEVKQPQTVSGVISVKRARTVKPETKPVTENAEQARDATPKSQSPENPKKELPGLSGYGSDSD